jgi:hypothetical protein
MEKAWTIQAVVQNVGRDLHLVAGQETCVFVYQYGLNVAFVVYNMTHMAPWGWSD